MNDPLEAPMLKVPTVELLVKHGDGLAVIIALLPLALAAILGFIGLGWGWIAAGVAGSALLWLVFKSYVEIVRIIADTLLPR